MPDRRWLAELLADADDESIGCFAGEIEPRDPVGFVARYVHERRLISQLYLLTRTPPAAATGCVAYRRTVFDAIGLFDESLPGGEDSDLFWRMVKSERFRVRYNPRALVAHAHPASVAAFARRSYREGVALGAFRRKHRTTCRRRTPRRRPRPCHWRARSGVWCSIRHVSAAACGRSTCRSAAPSPTRCSTS